MLSARWSERSLSFWVILSMALTVLPLVLSTVAVHVLFSRGVISAYDDVATRYRDHVGPMHRLQVAMWETDAHLDNYVETREARSLDAYRARSIEISAAFSKLQRDLGRNAAALGRAQQLWVRAQGAAERVFAAGAALDARDVDETEAATAAAVIELRGLDQTLTQQLSIDHAAAVAAYDRATKLSQIAALVSLVALVFGVVLISRVMLDNVARLVSGARRFADGDREHLIEIQVPMELREVAREFNRMIGRIREAEATLAEEARHDPMTGLPNRRMFDGAISDAFARLARMKEPFALIMLDLDHFKRVNDTYGHSVGDDVLRATAKTLGSAIRAVDKAFRLGGEEFAILLAGADLTGAGIGAERVRQAIACAVIESAGVTIPVTASIGVAQASPDGTVETLYRAADQALYQAKSAGRNRVVSSAPPPSVARVG